MSLQAVKSVEYLHDVVPSPEVSLQPYKLEDFDTAGITPQAVQQMADTSYADGKVFAARLNLHNFEERERNHQLGLDEDPVRLYDQLQGDINQRILDLLMAKQILPSYERQIEDLQLSQFGAAAIRGSVQPDNRLQRHHHDLAA